jgi:hypothetical protein
MEAYICTRKNTFFYIENIDCKSRRGAGVAERGSLLRSCTFTGTGGSNPSPQFSIKHAFCVDARNIPSSHCSIQNRGVA